MLRGMKRRDNPTPAEDHEDGFHKVPQLTICALCVAAFGPQRGGGDFSTLVAAEDALKVEPEPVAVWTVSPTVIALPPVPSARFPTKEEWAALGFPLDGYDASLGAAFQQAAADGARLEVRPGTAEEIAADVANKADHDAHLDRMAAEIKAEQAAIAATDPALAAKVASGETFVPPGSDATLINSFAAALAEPVKTEPAPEAVPADTTPPAVPPVS